MTQNDIRKEIALLVNSLKELFNEIHCNEAKVRLLEAQMWAERKLTTEDIDVSLNEKQLAWSSEGYAK